MPQSEQQPITFLNKNGNRLFGIVHIPTQPRKDIGIILLNPGVKSRVAPHRLYVKMARHISSLGFYVLRFDAEGLGDSEGEINEKWTADLYGSIQVGRLVDDTIRAMDWMQNEYGLSRFILSGLCGGAITGLLTGSLDHRVDSLYALGMPVIMDGSNIDHTQFMTRGQLEDLGRGYARKFISPRAWLRFLTLQSDYRVMLKSLLQLTNKNQKKASLNNKKCHRSSTEPFIPVPRNNLNPHFPDAFKKMVSSSRNILLIFSELDRLYWEFQEKYLQDYQESIDKYKHNYQIAMVKNANHIFSFPEWEKEMVSIITSRLKTNFR